MTPGGRERRSERAARELAELRAQAEAERTTLSRLQREVAEAETRLGETQAGQLLVANERLVLAALRAQADVETATRVLNEVSRTSGLDALTNLPNRVLLLDRFGLAIASAKRRGTRLALLFLDLNDFKQINDSLGHAVGDEVLKQVAHRLTSAVRQTDTVSRHGGDEFVILLTDVSENVDAGLVADKVIAALGVPSHVGENLLRLKASIGISIYPDDGDSVDQLMDRADAAMYRAKRRGLGGFVFHGEEPRAEGSADSPAPAFLHRTLTPSELVLAEHELRDEQVRDAKEQLERAALRAQELQAASDQMQRRQTEFLAMLALEMLRNPAADPRSVSAAAADSSERAAAG